jgi:hypothetical protein
MFVVPASHHGYSDETNHNTGRFKGIGLVTACADTATRLSNEVREILASANVSELKWAKVRTARDRLGAIRVLEWVFNNLHALRVDVLTWDIEDGRHKIDRRDDAENIHRMYHHLLRNVLQRKWPDDSAWRLFPDEQDSMDWQRVHDVLDSASGTNRNQGIIARMRSLKEFRVVQVTPCRSHNEPLIQLADLFAGVAAFSRANLTKYQHWKQLEDRQTLLFAAPTIVISSGEREKFAFLSELHHKCKQQQLRVSLNSTGGLETRDPNLRLNFWHYATQRYSDKAPTRPMASNA